MSKKSATKISILLFSIFSCLFLFSCANEAEDYTPSKEELYKSMIGTWILEETDETGDVISQVGKKITITEKTFKNVKTIEEMRKTNERSKNDKTKQSVIETINRYSLADYDLCSYSAYETLSMFGSLIKSFSGYKIHNEKLHIVDYSCTNLFEGSPTIKCYQMIYRLDKSTSENNNTGSSITDSDLLGSYTISEANGSTFTFASDSTWTYKYNSRTTEGTWSVSDGKLTITYSLGGYSSSAIFSASVSGDTYTLTGKSGDYVTIISSAFMITDQDAVANGVVTLIKQ